MAPVLCRQVVPVAALAAAQLSYCCLPAAAALQLHYVCQDTFLCITLNKHSVLPSLHSHPGAAFNPSLVLPHLWDVPMPRFCHLSEDTVLHPPQVLLLWPLFMPASELNKLHSSQKLTVKEDLGTSSHPRLQFSGVRGGRGGGERPTSFAASGSWRSFPPALRSWEPWEYPAMGNLGK